MNHENENSLSSKSPSARHPRWTRQETFVLIQGKKDAENRVQKDRSEPKWDFVSSYCKRHGVNREPVQCRKRWSNLLGDFKKVKSWDSENEHELYWVMRSEVRRERKLPGLFDKGVFDVLDGKEVNEGEFSLALVLVKDEEGHQEEEIEADFDGRKDEFVEDGVISDSEQSAEEETEASPQSENCLPKKPAKTVLSPMPISEKGYQPLREGYSSYQDTPKGKEASPGGRPGEGRKRRRVSECEETNMEERLMKVIEVNSNMLKTQLEAQNLNSKQNTEQQKDLHNSLIAALGKLTDVIAKIAEKL